MTLPLADVNLALKTVGGCVGYLVTPGDTVRAGLKQSWNQGVCYFLVVPIFFFTDETLLTAKGGESYLLSTCMDPMYGFTKRNR